MYRRRTADLAAQIQTRGNSHTREGGSPLLSSIRHGLRSGPVAGRPLGSHSIVEVLISLTTVNDWRGGRSACDCESQLPDL